LLPEAIQSLPSPLMAKSGKIINDPVHGFITLPSGLIMDLIDHPFFQRLRRIRQLGLTELVYPGANHTRFHHALGAMHLMGLALETLREKGHLVSAEEEEAARIAILMHDIGHGPFSHALENSILEGISHEQLSLLFMERLNFQFGGRLDLAIRMFKGSYERPFFYQLIASQLDLDRMDYLLRDCFFTGVAEGSISAGRLLKMIGIHKEELVIEDKAIYSVENFLSSRRLMYWQVYLHKTTVSAEEMLIQLMRRARMLMESGMLLNMPAALEPFFRKRMGMTDFISGDNMLNAFSMLDDYDIWYCIKSWASHPDFVLSYLARGLMDRRLLKVSIHSSGIGPEAMLQLRQAHASELGIREEESAFLVFEKEVSNSAYISGGNVIRVKFRDGSLLDVAEATDLPNIRAMAAEVKKYIVCQPKTLSLRPS
jgi:HD superfamily phosphohydrolase